MSSITIGALPEHFSSPTKITLPFNALYLHFCLGSRHGYHFLALPFDSYLAVVACQLIGRWGKHNGERLFRKLRAKLKLACNLPISSWRLIILWHSITQAQQVNRNGLQVKSIVAGELQLPPMSPFVPAVNKYKWSLDWSEIAKSLGIAFYLAGLVSKQTKSNFQRRNQSYFTHW